MPDVTFLGALSIVTLLIVVALGIFQLLRVRKSQAKRGEKPGGIAGPTA